MTTAEVILLACVIVGTALSWIVSGWLHFEKGTQHGRELESLDQMGRSNPIASSTVFDRSRKTFPGMSEVKAVDLGKARK